MLTLELVEECDEKMVYHYYPEGKAEFGTVSINKDTGEILVLKTAKGDEFGFYKFHVLSTLQKYYESGEYKQKDMVAWY